MGFYRMNELIQRYAIQNPSATVYRLNCERGLVVFEDSGAACLRMYNASMELLHEWTGADRHSRADAAFEEEQPHSIGGAVKDMFDNRELALMSIAISKYISDENCKEPQAVEFELREIVRKLDYLISAESDIRRQPDHTAIMNMNDHQEMNNRHVGLTGAEEITCDNCCESVVFHLRDNKHDFTMGLSTVLECLMFAVQQGDLPKLPLSWLSNADDVCGTGYAENPQYFYADERNYQRKDARS